MLWLMMETASDSLERAGDGVGAGSSGASMTVRIAEMMILRINRGIQVLKDLKIDAMISSS